MKKKLITLAILAVGMSMMTGCIHRQTAGLTPQAKTQTSEITVAGDININSGMGNVSDLVATISTNSWPTSEKMPLLEFLYMAGRELPEGGGSIALVDQSMSADTGGDESHTPTLTPSQTQTYTTDVPVDLTYGVGGGESLGGILQSIYNLGVKGGSAGEKLKAAEECSPGEVCTAFD